MKQVNLKELKKGEYFTMKPIEEPTEDQVWVKGEYIRQAGKYSTYKFIDTNHEILRKGDTRVYINFSF